MDKRKPTIIKLDVSETEATLAMKVDADILDFRGHFTHFPLLPGVSQIDWALFYAVEHLNTPPLFKGMEVIKFQEPILPDAEVTLSLSWDQAKGKLAFKYSSQKDDNLVIHSSGKMKLGV
ncbi:3-hydroxyacyl-ACP dehydratase [Vibrio sp. UCD-FRSSP16_10]|uniref:ApeI family dehydratase n=1 Tax=unclassified Vibrio TaxID=2614977 RepID=UPI0008012109|nr:MULTISPECIES: 3-hydroxyacyl-ACP dehydratase [unclassified Vibrio]OBT14817.1 3-hydroxyacyl-ACP dehydratase [Vibrio sp. UCD-FRSSP16_30]OBT20105.1 3-hydroxyacyl-ACP dehydratase [Vibrio sp. UCD-FRSSP16_10]